MNCNDFGLTRNLTAAAAIKTYRVVAFATAEGEVETAVSATAKPFIGVTGVRGAVAAKERVDVHLAGVHMVEAGAAFAQGLDLTVDSEGRVIAAAPGAAATHRVIGQALGLSTALGHLVPVRIAPGALSNAANS